jgi:hypothetical protein
VPSIYATRPIFNVILPLTVASIFSFSTAEAALVDAGNGLINDTDLNITWLQDANLAATNTFGVAGIPPSGAMLWATANAWIAAMNAANYKGYSDWRLPIVTPVNGNNFNYSLSTNGTTDFGYYTTLVNTTASELPHVFYNELGNKGSVDVNGRTQLGGGVTNTGPFQNLLEAGYWTGAEYGPNPNLFVWAFDAFNGRQVNGGKGAFHTAWAVRSGQATVVPIPASAWLFGSVLAGLGFFGKRRAA